MRTTINILLALALTCSYCFARSSRLPGNLPAQTEQELKTITGLVKNVFLPDPAKGILPALAIGMNDEQSLIVLLDPTTTIYDVSQGTINPEDIKTDDTVKGEYCSEASQIERNKRWHERFKFVIGVAVLLMLMEWLIGSRWKL